MSRTADFVFAGNLTLATVIWFLAWSSLYFRLRCSGVRFCFQHSFAATCSQQPIISNLPPHSLHCTSVFIDGVDSNTSLLEYSLFSQFRPREFAFCLLINHAFHIQVNSRAKDDIWKKRLWSWMGKHNIQAKKSVKLDTIPSLYSTKPMFLLQTLTNAVQRFLRADGGLFVLTHLEVTRVIVGRAIGANNVMSVSIPCT